jgi:hypothetical protein
LAKADTAFQAHPLVNLTEPCLAAVLDGRAPAAKVTLLENPPSPIGLGCADIANHHAPGAPSPAFRPFAIRVTHLV